MTVHADEGHGLGGTRSTGDDRPVIQIVPGHLPRQVAELREALIAGDANLYQRAGELVTIAKEPERREVYERDRRVGSEIIRRPGTPKIHTLSHAALALRSAIAVKWVKWNAKQEELVAVDPCQTTVAMLRGDKTKWFGIPPLKGILETPCFARGGRLISRPGYDEETACMMLPTVDPGTIAEKPTRDHARAALQYLWIECFSDFPYKGLGEPSASDPDRVLQYAKAVTIPDAFVPAGAMLTVFARPAIEGPVPATVLEASSQGAGKSRQMHVISLVISGRCASVMTFPFKDGKPNEEELEKVLGCYAMDNAQVVAFDNVRGTLGGPSLEKVLTAQDMTALRVLGYTTRLSLPWIAIVLFSCNNVALNDDMAQRSLISRLISPREDPRSRPATTFRHADLYGAIRERRAKLVRAALVILRSYLAATPEERAEIDDESREGAVLGSFESWSRIIPRAIMWAGGPNILLGRPAGGSGTDEDAEAHAALVRHWPRTWDWMRTSVIRESLFQHEREIAHGKAPPDGFDEMRSAVRALTRVADGRTPTAQQIGIAFAKLKEKLRDGGRLLRDIDGHTKSPIWRMERT